MATTATQVLTWEQFEKLPDSDGVHRELIEGELQTLPPAKLNHSRVAKRALRLLLQLEDRGVGEALAEAGYRLSKDPATWLQPDVSFVTSDRANLADESGYHEGAPNLAVEVVSPSESASDLERKTARYLEAGSAAVWVVYPRSKKVEVHLPNRTSFTRGTRDMLDAPFLLQSWQVPVAKLFED